jgi:hypothetical protein
VDREATLDLPDDELRALLDGALAPAAREIDATRTGPVFAQRPKEQHSWFVPDGTLADTV